MIYPTIHNNGSDPAKLIDGYREAAEALRVALDKVEGCAPHCRDYYVASTDAMNGASVEHTERIQKLISVLGDVISLLDNVHHQVDVIEHHRKLRFEEAKV
jgi:hypothetical protein